MRSTFLVLASGLAPALAQMGSDLAIQIQVVAGQDTQATLSAAAIGNGEFDTYNVYLAATPPGWGTGPICILNNGSSTKDSTIKVNIPASVGPSGKFYSLSYVLLNSNVTSDNDATESGFDYSNDFALVHTTGNWSEYELSGHTIGTADDIPCSAYDCARQCNQKYYPANTGNDTKSYDDTYSCMLKCPGVVADQDEEADGSAAATSGGSVSSQPTQTGTASTGSSTGSATGSTSATGSATKTTGSASTSATGSSTGSASAAGASSTGAAEGLRLNFGTAAIAGALGVAAVIFA